MNRPVVKINSKLPKNIKDFHWAEAIVKLDVDLEEYLPISERYSNFFYLKAKLNQDLIIPPAGVSNIDCGFSLELSSNYKYNVFTLNDYSDKGLIILNKYFNQRVIVAVKNLSEINNIIIKNLDNFALLVIEPSLLI